MTGPPINLTQLRAQVNVGATSELKETLLALIDTAEAARQYLILRDVSIYEADSDHHAIAEDAQDRLHETLARYET